MHRIIKSAVLSSVGTVIIRIFRIKTRVFLVGDGRSGTTWVSQVLNFDGNMPEIFEPFHGRVELNLSDDRLYPTKRDLDIYNLNTTGFLAHLEKLILLRHCRANFRVLPNLGVVVKDISVHMILEQLFCSEQTLIYIIRNPISVALSKERYGQWHSAADLRYLTQYSPILKELSEKCYSQNLISSQFLSYVFAWGLLNRIALSQMGSFNFPVIFYENLLRTPEKTFEDLFRLAGLYEKFINNKSLIMEAVNKESVTTVKDNTINEGKQNDPPWIGKVSKQELSKAYKILKILGLYEIYEDSFLPNISRDELKDIASRWS